MSNDNEPRRYTARYLATVRNGRTRPGWYVFDGERIVSQPRPTRLMAERTIAVLEANDQWQESIAK